MSHHPTECQDCRAYINRERYAPFCERGTWLGGIGCLKRSAQPPVHQGEPPTTPAPKKRGRRKS